MARKAMNSLDVHVAVNLLHQTLRGARLDNIYWPPGRNGVLMKFKGPGGSVNVIAEPSVRIHATSRAAVLREVVPTGFVAVMRRRVRGSRLEGVRQLGFDRLAELSFSTGHKLYVEIMPRGALVLVNGDGVVEATTLVAEFRDRVLKPKVRYRPPPLQEDNPFLLPPEALAELASKGADAVRGLIRGARVPGEAAEEALDRCGVDYAAHPSSLGGGVWECVAGVLQDIYRESLQGRGYLCRGEKGLEANPFRRERLECSEHPTFHSALDELFTPGGGEAGEEPEVARLRRSMEEAVKLAEEYRRRAGELRRAAEAVASSYQQVDEALRRAVRGEALPPVAEVRGNKVILELGGIRVEATRGEDAGRLILRLYREAGELEAKAERAEKAFAEARSRLEEAVRRARLRRLRRILESRRRFWFEKYHWTITRGGFLAIGGRDAGQNESVVKRYLGHEDIFLHADIHGAPATVLLTRRLMPGEEDIYDAAVLAAAYSKAWKAGAGGVSVYWVYGRQVSKTPPSGEYLARGAFMVYGKRNYIHHVPLRLALGVAMHRDLPQIVVGSEDAVSRYAIAYAILLPGDMSVGEAAEKLRATLSRIVSRAVGEEAALKVEALPSGEIEARLPGRSRIAGARAGSGDARLFEEALKRYASSEA
ncbi:ribosome rescue protein RqcH [Aeropyrum camini]|uniref:Predicted RNA-binding proteinp n=1 Tax=Aeropyrum camini SY1 = JCM 12091 TaxID=1198449 RepID=U3TEL9_9CREN|nr:ribosome rescue protein RqcH [Aeropyrum camini]BAN90480.1 predicted RNA-binding proteinp [Aeropyrum camini SY1 = JCM 12091]